MILVISELIIHKREVSLVICDLPPTYPSPVFPDQDKAVYLNVPPITLCEKNNKIIHFTRKTESNLRMETTSCLHNQNAKFHFPAAMRSSKNVLLGGCQRFVLLSEETFWEVPMS